MLNPTKLNIAVVFGGKSGEHEISLLSGASVMDNLDRQLYNVQPVLLDKQGLYQDQSLTHYLTELQPDVIFPVLHGPLYEDGSVQGLFELLNMAYVGSGVLASAINMDKDMTKRLAIAEGIATANYLRFNYTRDAKRHAAFMNKVVEQLDFPLFVKPANMGSSLGISRVDKPNDLVAAMQKAFVFTDKIIVEEAIDGREIELAVLENEELSADPRVSLPGEICLAEHHQYYDYAAKYLDIEALKLIIPADLTPSQVEEAQALAAQVFELFDLRGMARVDLFLDRKSGHFFFNEINTIPGFTALSMYPKLWEVSGLAYSELLNSLIRLALARHHRSQRICRHYEK